MIERFREMEGWKYKLSVLFCGPGWGPGKPRTGDIKDIPVVCVNCSPFSLIQYIMLLEKDTCSYHS